jgi:acyl-coenzyme A synthetase/AMP-(fatty) acid ligase
MMLIDLLLHHPNGDHIVYRDGIKDVTVRDLQIMCQSTALSLKSIGVNPGDRVALIGNDSAEWAATFWALVLLGAHAVILHANMPQDWTDGMLKQYNIKLVCSDRSGFQGINVFEFGSCRMIDVKETITAFDYQSDTVMSFLSSGTNGTVKLIEHTNQSLCGSIQCIEAYSAECKITPNDVIFCGAKMSFAMGWMFNIVGGLYLQTTVITGTSLSDMRNFSSLVDKFQINHVVLTPFVLDIIHRANDRLPPTIKTIITGAEPLPNRLVKDLRKKFSINVKNCYGLSELFLVTITQNERIDNSIGKFVDGIQYQLVDDSGNAIGRAGCGILQIKCQAQFVSYLDDPESTQQVIKQGWVHTNDIVDISDDGEVFFLGRANSCIKVKGHWVSLLEIEELITTVDGISDCVVVKCEDQNGFDSISAFVVVNDRHELSCTDIVKDRIRSVLGKKYLMPTAVYLVDEIPRTNNLKKLRNIAAMNQWLEQRNTI